MKLGGNMWLIYVLLGYSTIGLCNSTCQDTLTSIRHLVLRDHETTFDGEGDTSNCGARPGKRGAVGPPGPDGPKGEQGACSCDLEEITKQRQELKGKVCTNVYCSRNTMLIIVPFY